MANPSLATIYKHNRRVTARFGALDDHDYGGEADAPSQAEFKIKFIRAAYNRSVVVVETPNSDKFVYTKNIGNDTTDHLLVWGQSHRYERLLKPQLVFSEPGGIHDVKLGLNHGLFIR